MDQKENGKLYRLEEMSDSMGQTIEHVRKLTREQEALLAVIKASNKAKDFASFIKEMDDTIVNNYKQIEKLLSRKETLDKAIKACKNDKKCEDVMNLLLVAFGIFED